jgi:hypothetical protein
MILALIHINTRYQESLLSLSQGGVSLFKFLIIVSYFIADDKEKS